MWLVPLVSMLLAVIATRLVRWLDRLTGWTLDVSVDGARAVGGTLTSALLTFIVDIASKALSPAINDPTTAVLSLDQIHHLLRQAGLRQVDAGQVPDGREQSR